MEVSGMIPRINLKEEIPKLNSALRDMCRKEGMDYISNNNIYYGWHLAKDNVHLNFDGVEILERNFIHSLTDLKLGNEE